MQGDLASLRVILGVVVIWIIFQSQNDRFLTAVNLTNLMLQITAVGLISVGVVYVLLLGEIDLSVGAVSGLAAAVMAVLNVKHGWDPYLAIAAGVAVRDGDRRGAGRALHQLRHPVVRGHARRAPDLAGSAALRARRHRHDQHHGQQDHRPRQHLLLGCGRLDHGPGGDRRLRGGQPVGVAPARGRRPRRPRSSPGR